MNIEKRFLKKAIENKNYISFIYKQRDYKKIKPLKLDKKENTYLLYTSENSFEFDLISKLQILKQSF